MNPRHAWIDFPETYREAEVEQLVRWLVAGQSGSVVGLPGCGRSNLLGFLSLRTDVIRRHAGSTSPQLMLIHLDLHTLPSADAAMLYRALLRALYHRRRHFEAPLQEEIARAYVSTVDRQDPFLTQSYLQDLLFLMQEEQIRVALILNHFDHFVARTTSQTLDTLRGLRDGFRSTLCMLVGTGKALTHFHPPDRLGELYELLDRNVCWVGAMTWADARNLLARATVAADRALTPDEVEMALELSGRFPALLKLIALWWLRSTPVPPLHRWFAQLKAQANVQHRLTKMWQALTQEEQFCLYELYRLRTRRGRGANAHRRALEEEYEALFQQLSQKGVCHRTTSGWRVTGHLFKAHVEKVGPSSRGKIWRDAVTREIYQGSQRLEDLTPLEQQLLHYFLDHPREPKEKDELIHNLWPEKSDQIIDNDLQQLVYRVRKKVDTSPPQYIITWKGRPGGYQFYPEGRPA